MNIFEILHLRFAFTEALREFKIYKSDAGTTQYLRNFVKHNRNKKEYAKVISIANSILKES